MRTYKIEATYIRNNVVNLAITTTIEAACEEQAMYIASIQWKGSDIKVLETEEVH